MLFGVLGTFSDDDDGSDGGSDVNSDLGDVRSQVIAEINSTTDCGELQAAFDRNDANHARNLEQGKLDLAQLNTDYMIAIDDRMRDIGCYGG